ncbi:ECF transporter S component [Pseudobdellovibrio sp. HCB154]|uniref:ECF transporter S component n=1 Tax=Pseudobdellovibrio sp. HCB154 TaxID=3386277 RepID=UPI00391725BC
MSQSSVGAARAQTTIHQLLKNYTIFEMVFICVSSVALGVAFWGWTFAYEITKPALKLVGLNYLAAGFWIFASVFTPLIIRRPFVAIIASVIAAGVEGVITHWGAMALVWGLVQGLGAEVIFAATGYRKWSLYTMLAASMMSATASFVLDYFYYGYSQMALPLQLTQYLSFVMSAAVLAGLLSHILFVRLKKLNLLNRYLAQNI